MKKYAPYFLKTAIVAVIVAVTLVACETTDPDGPLDPRDNFIGSWFCTETPTNPAGPNVTFNVNITKDVNDDTQTIVKISNFSSLNGLATATISGNTMSIATQSVDGNTIQGSGTYNAATDKINLNYTVNDGLQSTIYSAVYSK